MNTMTSREVITKMLEALEATSLTGHILHGTGKASRDLSTFAECPDDICTANRNAIELAKDYLAPMTMERKKEIARRAVRETLQGAAPTLIVGETLDRIADAVRPQANCYICGEACDTRTAVALEQRGPGKLYRHPECKMNNAQANGSNWKPNSHPFLPPADELQALEDDVTFGEITEEIRAKRLAAGLNPDTGAPLFGDVRTDALQSGRRGMIDAFESAQRKHGEPYGDDSLIVMSKTDLLHVLLKVRSDMGRTDFKTEEDRRTYVTQYVQEAIGRAEGKR